MRAKDRIDIWNGYWAKVGNTGSIKWRHHRRITIPLAYQNQNPKSVVICVYPPEKQQIKTNNGPGYRRSGYAPPGDEKISGNDETTMNDGPPEYSHLPGIDRPSADDIEIFRHGRRAVYDQRPPGDYELPMNDQLRANEPPIPDQPPPQPFGMDGPPVDDNLAAAKPATITLTVVETFNQSHFETLVTQPIPAAVAAYWSHVQIDFSFKKGKYVFASMSIVNC